MLRPRLGVAEAAVSATQLPQWTGVVGADVPKTVGSEDLVRLPEAVVQAYIELVLVVQHVGREQVIVDQPRQVGEGIEIGYVRAHLVDHGWWNDIELSVVGDRTAQGRYGTVRTREVSRAIGVEDCARVELWGTGTG